MTWLYTQADTILEEKLKNEGLLEADTDIDRLVKEDPPVPEVPYSIDAEGELTSLDDFEDPTYIHNLYDVQDIFSDDKDEAIYIQQLVDDKISRN